MRLGIGLGVSLGSPAPLVLDPSLAVFVGASLEANNHSIGGSASSNAELKSTFRAPIVLANALAGSPLKIMASFERTLTAPTDGIAFLRRGSNDAYGSRTMISVDEVVRNRVVNCAAGVVIMSPGRNWVGNTDTSLAEQLALYVGDAALLRAQGRVVGHAGIGCKPAYVEGDSNFNAVVAMDTALRSEAAAHGEMYVDVAAATHLAGAPNLYTSDPACFGDGTHYNAKGGARVAEAYRSVIAARFGAWPNIDAVLNNHDTGVYGYNRNTNPFLELTGANGSKSGTGITAETIVPTGYVLYGSSSTVTVAGAFVTRSGRPWYELTITPPGVPGAAQTIRVVRNQGSPAGFYEYSCRVEVEANTSLIYCSPRLLLNAAPTVTTSVMALNDSDATNNLLGGYEARCRGMVLEHLGSGTPTTELRVQVDPAGSTPFKIWTTEWMWAQVDHKGNFPDASVIRGTDGDDESIAA